MAEQEPYSGWAIQRPRGGRALLMAGASETAPRGPRPPAPVPRITVTPDEAAAALGVSRDFFDEHVLHEVAHVRRGRRRLIPVANLERWAAEHASRWSE